MFMTFRRTQRLQCGTPFLLEPSASDGAHNLDALSLFGLLSVTAMLVFYAFESRSAWFALAFAGACAAGSTYGFLQGAWPFGLVEAVWAIVAVRKWWRLPKL